MRMANLEEELQKIYDSEIHVDIGWLWDGGIDVSVGDLEVKGHVATVAEVLPWLQDAIAKHYPDSKYNVERMGGTWKQADVGWATAIPAKAEARKKLGLVDRNRICRSFRYLVAFVNAGHLLIASVFPMEHAGAAVAFTKLTLVGNRSEHFWRIRFVEFVDHDAVCDRLFPCLQNIDVDRSHDGPAFVSFERHLIPDHFWHDGAMQLSSCHAGSSGGRFLIRLLQPDLIRNLFEQRHQQAVDLPLDLGTRT